ncbi:MAG: DUF4012 domain-containing protein [Patescibacteria group bacterium]
MEAQLAGVLEQDGITMVSPEGIHRRAKRPKKTVAKKSVEPIRFLSESNSTLEDGVADLDRATIGLLVKPVGVTRPQLVQIHAEERPRSEFVLSLRNLALQYNETETEERVSVHDAYAENHAPQALVGESSVYGTLTQDLALDAIDPQDIAEQFTPRVFEVAYTRVYGRFDRVTSFVRAIADDVTGLFHTVERIERAVSDDVQSALHVVEVPRFSFARALAGFVGLMLVVTLPANAVTVYRTAMQTRDATERAGNAAVGELLGASSGGSLPSTEAALQRASSKFREADAELTQSSALAIGIASVLPKQYRSARALLEVGDKASQAGQLLAQAFDKIFSDPGRRLDERLDVLAAYARAAVPLLTDASKAAATIDPTTLPEDKREEFKKLSAGLEGGTQAVRDFAGMADMLAIMSGKDRKRTYLFIFQNNTELRPTGGFMGSVAEVDLDRGAVTKVRVPPGGTYDLKGQLLEHVISPQPLHLINAGWQFQDANWSPDFPTAAEKIRWFWSKSGQPTLDGIIAINASFVENMLDITGPIDMPAYGKVIDKTNFLIETQKSVEIEYDKEANTPKKFVGDLVEAMRERMKTFTSEDWLKVAALASDSLQSKDIQVALMDPEQEEVAERYGWSGKLKETPGDSLALIEANIAGQKTDGVISETADVHVGIQPDGAIIDTVKLTRTHHGQKGELFRGVRNVSYLRAYIPKGSELLAASGFEAPPASLFKKPDEDYLPDADVVAVEDTEVKGIGGTTIAEEGSRSVVGGWMQLDPGESQTITLQYRLPFTTKSLERAVQTSPGDEAAQTSRAYLMLLTSQSGKSSRELTTTIAYPPSWKNVWSHGVEADAKTLTAHTTWSGDKVVGALFTTGDAQQ